MSIFIQVASYRDPELLPTIRDCIANAKWPLDLRFGICLQDEESNRDLLGLQTGARFAVDFVPWQEAKGLCAARARIQRLYEGEDFTLQIDSHMRFAPNWDETLLKMLEQTGSAKPIIGSYAGSYDPITEERSTEPFKMVPDRFTDGGTILFMPHVIQGWRDLSAPVRARFVSGHFAFTIGKFCEEIPVDPLTFFAGEELLLSVRTFTHGYDAYHPHRLVLWHEYTRAGRTKIWDDDPVWHEKDAISKRRLRKLLHEEENDSDLTGFDLGTVRTHAEYEAYAGIDFARRRLHPDALAGIEPPTSAYWTNSSEKWYDSAHCRSAAHCQSCRHDPSFRQSIVDSGMMTARDFDCPFGMSPPSIHEGCGTKLSRLISKLGITKQFGCECHSHILELNARGPDWMRENAAIVVGWMRGEAERRGLLFIEFAARKIVLHCAR